MSARFLRFKLRGAAEPIRSRSLERLLACADEDTPALDWRADAFAVIAPGSSMPSIAAVALRAAGMTPVSSWVCLATPVHYLAELTNVRFAGDGILSLGATAAAALVQDFNGIWSGAGVYLTTAANRLFCHFDATLQVTTQDPEAVRGRHLGDFLPAGHDAARLRRLMSEMEMWLFDHAVNRSRTQQSQLPISGLWLWGGGVPLAALPAVQGTAAGADVFFDAFPAGSDRSADVMVVEAVPGTQAWAELESRWLKPTLAALGAGRITRLDLSAGERRFALTARWRRRFWRRAKPFWEYFLDDTEDQT